MNNQKPYAVINSQTHIIENVILWDGRIEPLEITAPEIIVDSDGNQIETGNTVIVEVLQPWKPPAGMYTLCIEGTEAGIGWKVVDGEFMDVRSIGQNNSTQ